MFVFYVIFMLLIKLFITWYSQP